LLSTNSNLYRYTTGKGPRHLLFHPTIRAAYLVNELDSTVSCFKVGGCTRVEVS
jgi:6-phosphogluconolactonase (cycloisomerase 2 family)